MKFSIVTGDCLSEGLQIALNLPIRHNAAVISPLSRLRRLIARAPFGLRAFVCLLVLSLGMAGTLSGELHQHEPAEQDHHHHAIHDHDTAPPAPNADDLPPTMHFHDAPVVAQAILNAEMILLPSLVPSSLCSLSQTSLRHACPDSPPHRPPIV